MFFPTLSVNRYVYTERFDHVRSKENPILDSRAKRQATTGVEHIVRKIVEVTPNGTHKLQH